MNLDKKEIFSSCCAFGKVTEEVHVLQEDCPINREVGKRESKGNHEATCVYISVFDGTVVTPCEHYKGIEKVKRNKETKYKVVCDAIKESDIK